MSNQSNRKGRAEDDAGRFRVPRLPVDRRAIVCMRSVGTMVTPRRVPSRRQPMKDRFRTGIFWFRVVRNLVGAPYFNLMTLLFCTSLVVIGLGLQGYSALYRDYTRIELQLMFQKEAQNSARHQQRHGPPTRDFTYKNVHETSLAHPLTHHEEIIRNMELEMEALEEKIIEMERQMKLMHDSTLTPTDRYGINVASIQEGAIVVKNLSTPVIVRSLWDRFHLTLWKGLGQLENHNHEWAIMDREVLQAGSAFCFLGQSGRLTVKFVDKVNIHAVDYKGLEEPYMLRSALYNYTLWGCLDNDCAKRKALQSCFYLTTDIHRARLCEVTAKVVVSMVQLEIHQNHGDIFTCLYRFRIFGSYTKSILGGHE